MDADTLKSAPPHQVDCRPCGEARQVAGERNALRGGEKEWAFIAIRVNNQCEAP